MKNQILALSTLLIMMVACSDNQVAPVAPTTKVTVTPFSTYLQQKPTLTLETFAGTYSIGYEFKLNAKGKVTDLGLAAPHAGTFKVQLYKVDSVQNTGTLVAEADVTLSDEDVANKKFAYKVVAIPVDLAAGEYYRVAYSEPDNKDFYRLQEQTNHSLPFVEAGAKVKVTKGVYGNIDSFPGESWNVLYTADLKLEFTN